MAAAIGFGGGKLTAPMPGKVVAVMAFAFAASAAAWIAGFSPSDLLVADVSPTAKEALSFNDRFAQGPATPSVDISARLLVQSWSSELELKLQQAKSRLANKLQSQKLALEEPPPGRGH